MSTGHANSKGIADHTYAVIAAGKSLSAKRLAGKTARLPDAARSGINRTVNALMKWIVIHERTGLRDSRGTGHKKIG